METGGRGALKWVRGLPQYESSSSLILVSFSSIVLIWRTLKACLLSCFFFEYLLNSLPKDVRLNTPQVNVNVDISCYTLYVPLGIFLNSHTLAASQPLHRTHHTGRDINTSHHFLSLSCSRLPQDGSTESNTIPLPKVSCYPLYLHVKWITNQQPPRRHTLRVRPSIFSTISSSF